MIIDQIIVDSPDDDHIIITARMVKGLGDIISSLSLFLAMFTLEFAVMVLNL